MHLSNLSLEQTATLGQAMARAIGQVNPRVILLYGDLGAGKTTLARTLVTALPGGAAAEVASPSFTICNIYSTQPLVYHFDLYRLAQGTHDAELEEALDSAGSLCLVEWPERLHERALPTEGIACTLTGNTTEVRSITLSPLGGKGQEFLVLCQGIFTAMSTV